MNRIVIFIFLVVLLGCNSKTNFSEKPLVNRDSILNQNFNKSLTALAGKYPNNYQGKLAPMDEKHFELIRSVFIPGLDSLTFDLKGGQKCNGCWLYRFIHIYNNHNDFVIPLTDDEIFWSQSGKNAKQNSIERLNFAIEFNNFIKAFKITEIHKLELILAEVMDLNNCQRINTADLPKMKVIFAQFKKDENQCDSCRLNLDSSLAITTNWLSQKKLVYSNGINIFLVDILEDKSITINNINVNCNYSMMY